CIGGPLWDRTLPHCSRNGKSRLINPAGAELCSDFQRPQGCSSRSHDDKHECCGCGSHNHNVQKCPRAEK
ncbi:hypothetical protein C8F01DRAFT_966118, partial [Mycena amicta]